jgi:methylated-DNA-[protein]-cysteine S-methyltransferase
MILVRGMWRMTGRGYTIFDTGIGAAASHGAHARAIPRGETRTYAEVAAHLRASGAVYSVAQAIGRNPFMIIVPCHRVLEAGNYADKISPHGGAISKRRLLSIEGTSPTASKTLFDVLMPVAPPRAHN